MPAYRKSAQVDMTHGSVLGRAALFALPICAGNILQLCTARWTRWSSAISATLRRWHRWRPAPSRSKFCSVSLWASARASPSSYRRRSAAPTMTSCKARAHLGLAAVCSVAAADRHRVPAGSVDAAADAGPGGRHAGGGAVSAHHDAGYSGQHGYNFNAGLLRGIGNSSSSLLLLFISCAANIVLDLVLTGALGLGIGGVGGSHGDCAVFVVDMQHFLHSPPLHRACAACFALRL